MRSSDVYMWKPDGTPPAPPPERTSSHFFRYVFQVRDSTAVPIVPSTAQVCCPGSVMLLTYGSRNRTVTPVPLQARHAFLSERSRVRSRHAPCAWGAWASTCTSV